MYYISTNQNKMVQGKLGRYAKSISQKAYSVNRALGVPRVTALKRANKAGRKVVALKTSTKTFKPRSYSNGYKKKTYSPKGSYKSKRSYGPKKKYGKRKSFKKSFY